MAQMAHAAHVLEHVPEKLTDFSDILDIGYIRCLIKDMLHVFEIEPICPDQMDRERFHVIGIGSKACFNV